MIVERAMAGAVAVELVTTGIALLDGTMDGVLDVDVDAAEIGVEVTVKSEPAPARGTGFPLVADVALVVDVALVAPEVAVKVRGTGATALRDM